MTKRAWKETAVATLIALTALCAHADDLSNLSVHGFLSQAYGRADETTVLGIPKEGTSDYRNAALQFSYQITDKDRMVLQLSHERIGSDPKASFLADVAFDWAFYEHKFSDRTRVKVGRVPIPLGIFNEVRDAGVILPFYRPPVPFYAETNFLNETLDGVIASQSLALGKWEFEVDPFAGGWNTLAVSGSSPLTPARVDDGVGANAWLKTPLSGLRVGGSFLHSTLRRRSVVTVTGTPAPAPTPEPRNVWTASAEGAFSRFSLRAEYSKSKDGDSRDRIYYALASVEPLEKLTVNLLYTKHWVRWYGGPRAGTTSAGSRDMALGVNYAFRPNLVVKLEGHDGEGFAAVGAPVTNRYGIASLAASF
jgi:hypothetical protein